MASQNSGDSLSASGARSRSRSLVPPVKYYHDDVALIRTVRVNCPTQGRSGQVDNVLDLQMLTIEKDTKISELEYERDVLRGKVKKLKQSTTELENQVAELAIENTEKFHAMETVKADKKLCIMLFMSWVVGGCDGLVEG
ncbi:3-isopropylmalate dehydrogenase chloroplastic, partial [Bienertia sinuspersici]